MTLLSLPTKKVSSRLNILYHFLKKMRKVIITTTINIAILAAIIFMSVFFADSAKNLVGSGFGPAFIFLSNVVAINNGKMIPRPIAKKTLIMDVVVPFEAGMPISIIKKIAASTTIINMTIIMTLSMVLMPCGRGLLLGFCDSVA